MPATKAELRAARKELNDKTPVMYQGEIFEIWGYVIGEKNLKEPYTPTDFKIVLIKEAINIWDNKTYNINNIKNIFKPNIDVGNWEAVLKVWLSVKTALKLPDWEAKGYIERRRALPDLYTDYTEELAEMDSAKPFADKYEKLYNYWKTDFKHDFNDHILDVDGLVLVKNKLTQLTNNQEKHTDYDAIKKERDNWVAIFPSPLTPNLVKTEYDKPKETHPDLPDNWKTELARIPELEKRPTQEDLNNAVKTETEKYKDYETIKKDKEQLATDLTSASNSITTLTSERDTAINELNPIKEYWDNNLKEKLKGGITIESLAKVKKAYEAIDRIEVNLKELDQAWVDNNLTDFSSDLDALALKGIREELDRLKTNRDKIESQKTQYLNKLLVIYKQQITEQTQTFYLKELKLDESDDIQPKYNGVDYLTLLDNLNGDSNPQEVINTFKLLALVCATEKAVKESSEWMKTNTFKNKITKANKLKYFVNIKSWWDRLGKLEPSKENNPLYHKDIDGVNKDFWKEQLNETIQLWQPQQ